MYELKIKSLSTIAKLMKKGASIKDALIRKGVIKINKDNTNMNSSTDKAKIFSKNKNVTNDGIVDARPIIITQPKITLTNPNATNTQMTNPKQPQQSTQDSSIQDKLRRHPRNKDR